MPNNYYENLGNTSQNVETPENENTNTPTPPDSNEPARIQPEPQNSTDNETSFPNSTTGQLTVSAFTANQISPVVSATVTVSSGNEENRTVVDTSVTDRSGKSTTFTLPAPSATLSQTPTAAAPFAVYQVSVSHPDFYDAIIENVQIFGGIVTQLPVNLIPLPELPNGDTTKFVIIPKQNL